MGKQLILIAEVFWSSLDLVDLVEYKNMEEQNEYWQAKMKFWQCISAKNHTPDMDMDSQILYTLE